MHIVFEESCNFRGCDQLTPQKNVRKVRKCLRSIFFVLSFSEVTVHKDEPYFAEPIPSLTVAAGRNAALKCVVENLGNYTVNIMHYLSSLKFVSKLKNNKKHELSQIIWKVRTI